MSRSIDQVNRHPERARHRREDLYAVLDAEHNIGSLSTVVDGRPWVVPMLFGRVGDRIILHGSTGAGALRQVAAGAPAALCVAHIDGWVYAHTLFDSSANYRSAVVHGELQLLQGTEAAEALNQLSECMMPGRAAEVPTHTRKHLAATQCLALAITDGRWTVKVRHEPPGQPDSGDDVDPMLWTGVLPIVSRYRQPESAPHLDPDIPVSASVLRYIDESGHGPAL